MRYRVILPRSVQRELDRLPDDVVKRILARLSRLEANPRPTDVKKLKGRDAWRIRVGDYRVITNALRQFARRAACSSRSRCQAHYRGAGNGLPGVMQSWCASMTIGANLANAPTAVWRGTKMQ